MNAAGCVCVSNLCTTYLKITQSRMTFLITAGRKIKYTSLPEDGIVSQISVH